MKLYLFVTALCFSLAMARRHDEVAINPMINPKTLRELYSSPLLPKDLICGESSRSTDVPHRIVGGRNARPGEYPSVVALQFNGKHDCGGTIVDNYHVVTAAHCLENVTAEDVTIVAGALTFEEANAKSGESGTSELQIIRVKALHLHPKYVNTSDGYDFAVMSLESALEFTDKVQPSCLWGVKDKARLNGAPAEAVGWGILEEGEKERPRILQKVMVPIRSQEDCAESLSDRPYEVVDSMMCAGFDEGGRDSCQSDSGGPLFIFHEGRKVLAGIVSFGVGCGEKGRFGVYARVSEELEWIASKLIPEEEEDERETANGPAKGPSSGYHSEVYGIDG